jgi:hypothetical protein
MRAPAWSLKDVKRSGEDAAEVLMLRGVLGPLSLSLHHNARARCRVTTR